jgi:hypothetical protein
MFAETRSHFRPRGVTALADLIAACPTSGVATISGTRRARPGKISERRHQQVEVNEYTIVIRYVGFEH